ncbi:hypothetical protein [Azotobacter beijerinckii]|uniref:hypothetical protein n=1 Tax=Azotobacter beijerinckii TaxID=170623 RepID=UPI001114374E|nr:hypothetical protein [Azotobacter beijerinckii]
MKRIYFFPKTLTVLSIVCTFYGGSARAEKWQGSVYYYDNGKTIPMGVTLAVDNFTVINERSGNIKYGLPWACGLELFYSGKKDDDLFFALDVPLYYAAPGPCKNLIGGSVRASFKENNKLCISTMTKDYELITAETCLELI